ncbi:MAG: NAD(P)/FAD-dependent oxidoreductase [Solirubrobacterales bacterium]
MPRLRRRNGKPKDPRLKQGGVVIAGGGLAAQRCVEGLRSRGYEGRIRMICGEDEQPYDRPPLSKGLLTGEVSDSELAFRPTRWYADNAVELILGRRAAALDAFRHRIELDDGSELAYDKLLIATGSVARRLPALDGFANVHYLRTLSDARRLRNSIAKGTRVAIVGAGFIGQEVASTALAGGAAVTLVEALSTPLEGILGAGPGRWFAQLHGDEGVDVRTATTVKSAKGNGRVEELVLSGRKRLACDEVVVGVGVAPAAEWLRGSGLETDVVLTDETGQTALPDVFAAGDVSSGFDPRAGEHRRSEHWDAAARQGSAVARAMLGDEPEPVSLPSFWSDQYGIRIQYAGHVDLADDVSVLGDPDERDFAVVYTRESRPVGVLAVGRRRDFARLRREIELGPEQPDQSDKE